MTDCWKPYEDFASEDTHVQSKAETFSVEGYKSLLHADEKEVKMIQQECKDVTIFDPTSNDQVE